MSLQGSPANGEYVEENTPGEENNVEEGVAAGKGENMELPERLKAENSKIEPKLDAGVDPPNGRAQVHGT